MPHDSQSGQTGGGTTFTRNLKSAMPESVQFVNSMDEAELLFIAGPTLCDRDTVRAAKSAKKPVVLRCDNIPEDHRNRGTGISRMKDFAEAADLVVFQSEWSRYMITRIVGGSGPVIYNGVDTKVFKPSAMGERPTTFIYVKYSRNECKRFEEAQMLFREYVARVDKHAKLLVVGRYDQELINYGLGFFAGEDVEYLGVLEHARLADAYRRADVFLFPSFGDACPNVVLEAMATGLSVVHHRWGGTRELVGQAGVALDYNEREPHQILEKAVELSGRREQIANYVRSNHSLERMAEEYLGVFKLLLLGDQKISAGV